MNIKRIPLIIFSYAHMIRCFVVAESTQNYNVSSLSQQNLFRCMEIK